jgi:hypothetical protein
LLTFSKYICRHICHFAISYRRKNVCCILCVIKTWFCQILATKTRLIVLNCQVKFLDLRLSQDKNKKVVNTISFQCSMALSQIGTTNAFSFYFEIGFWSVLKYYHNASYISIYLYIYIKKNYFWNKVFHFNTAWETIYWYIYIYWRVCVCVLHIIFHLAEHKNTDIALYPFIIYHNQNFFDLISTSRFHFHLNFIPIAYIKSSSYRIPFLF